jgi:hypothetical protein
MCFLWGMNWIFISQKKSFFVVTTVKTSNPDAFQVKSHYQLAKLFVLWRKRPPSPSYALTSGTFRIKDMRKSEGGGTIWLVQGMQDLRDSQGRLWGLSVWHMPQCIPLKFNWGILGTRSPYLQGIRTNREGNSVRAGGYVHFALLSCSVCAYSSVLKMEVICFSENATIFNGLHGAISQNIKFFKTKELDKIWGFHGGDHEEWRLLGCYAMWLLQEPAFRRNLVLPLSGWQ